MLPLVWAAACAAALAACSHENEKAQEAYTVGARLAAQDRAREAQHHAEMARLIDAQVLETRDAGRVISLYTRLNNKSRKTITSLDAGIKVYDAAGRRIGLTEIHLPKTVPARATTAFWYPMRYLRFSEDAGTMRLAAGKPKHVEVDVTEIKYSDGTDAGYDD